MSKAEDALVWASDGPFAENFWAQRVTGDVLSFKDLRAMIRECKSLRSTAGVWLEHSTGTPEDAKYSKRIENHVARCETCKVAVFAERMS
jgi:hypothetical protein